MAANTAPIFVRTPQIEWISMAAPTANTSKDLTSGTSFLVFTADATEGSFLEYIRVRPMGTNVQTVMRIFINNGSTTATLANNTLFTELQLQATTNSETASIAESQIPMNIALPPGYRVYITVATTVAAGFFATAVGGKY